MTKEKKQEELVKYLIAKVEVGECAARILKGMGVDVNPPSADAGRTSAEVVVLPAHYAEYAVEATRLFVRYMMRQLKASGLELDQVVGPAILDTIGHMAKASRRTD